MAAVCPLLTSGTNAINCIQGNCAFWDNTYAKCGVLAGPERIQDAFDRLDQAIKDIKVKL